MRIVRSVGQIHGRDGKQGAMKARGHWGEVLWRVWASHEGLRLFFGFIGRKYRNGGGGRKVRWKEKVK